MIHLPIVSVLGLQIWNQHIQNFKHAYKFALHSSYLSWVSLLAMGKNPEEFSTSKLVLQNLEMEKGPEMFVPWQEEESENVQGSVCIWDNWEKQAREWSTH